MKRIVKASQEDRKEILYTPAALLDLLSQVEELADYSIGLTEEFDGTLQLQIGNSFYALEPSDSAVDVSVDETSFERVEEANEEAYNNIVDIEDNEEVIEGGLIKEALKTLLIGGVVRLGKDYLKN